MALKIRKRLDEYRADVEKRVTQFNRGEANALDAVKGCFRDTRKLTRKLTRPRTPAERKKAIHTLNRGIEEYNSGHYRKAVCTFRDALHHDAGYARAWLYLGNGLYKQKRYQEAMDAWETAEKTEPASDSAEKAREKREAMQKGKAGVISFLKGH
jgi:tetratricopeptide (TPR) repeat protein